MIFFGCSLRLLTCDFALIAVDVSKFHDSAVPEHFVALIRILIDEEAQHGSAFEGPCMEFFLKERMFETLCTLGVKDVC